LRVEEEPPAVLDMRITPEEFDPFVFSAPGTPLDRPVEVLIPLAFPLVTFLIELLRLPLPCKFFWVKIMCEMESAVIEPFACLLF
jgi:hypothetical protein